MYIAVGFFQFLKRNLAKVEEKPFKCPLEEAGRGSIYSFWRGLF